MRSRVDVMGSSGRTAAMVAAVLFCGVGIARADGVTFSDTAFSSSDWAVVVYGTTGGATQSVSQESMGGNPGSYRRMIHSMPASSSISVFHFYTAASYDPGVLGAIASIDYSEDSIQFSPPFPGAAIGALFALRQGGNLWVADTVLTYTSTSWLTQPISGLSDADFIGIGVMGLPDFSASGGPIEFGYVRSNTNNSATTAYNTTHGIDNWSVTVHPASNGGIPEPGSLLLIGTAACAVLVRRRAGGNR